MKKFILLFIIVNNINYYSSAQDTSLCKAFFSYKAHPEYSAYQGVLVNFYDQSQGDIIKWEWSYGDSIFSNEQNPVYVFEINRYLKCKSTKCLPQYYVCLTITTSDSCKSTYCTHVNPYENPIPQCEVIFNYYPYDRDSIQLLDIRTPSDRFPISFFGISDNDVVKWHWDFGDSTYSEEQNPVHAYYINSYWRNADCGKKGTNCIPSYYVCLTITTSDSCQASYCDYVYPSVNPTPTCNASFSYNLINSDSTMFQFKNKSEWDGGTVLWSFGDGTFSYEENPAHIFPNYNLPPIDTPVYPVDTPIYPIDTPIYYIVSPVKSMYTVCLTITGNNGCISTYCQDVYVEPSNVNLCNNFIKLKTSSILGTSECNGTASAELVDASGNPVNVRSYLWSTGSNSSEINNLCNNIPYYVSLTNEQGCVTTGSFTFSDNLEPWYIQYQNDSSIYSFEYLNYNPGYNYEWSFCDGSVETGYYITQKQIDSAKSCWVDLKVTDGSGNLVNNKRIYLSVSSKDNNLTGDNELILYPVPPSNILNIRINGHVNSFYKVDIIDIMGRYKISENVENNSNLYSVNIEQLPKGIYICRVKAGNKILTSRFIK